MCTRLHIRRGVKQIDVTKIISTGPRKRRTSSYTYAKCSLPTRGFIFFDLSPPTLRGLRVSIYFLSHCRLYSITLFRDDPDKSILASVTIIITICII